MILLSLIPMTMKKCFAMALGLLLPGSNILAHPGHPISEFDAGHFLSSPVHSVPVLLTIWTVVFLVLKRKKVAGNA